MNPNIKKILIGLSIVILTLIFATFETSYFGWNWLASSNAEKICDIIALVLYFIGMYISYKGFREIDIKRKLKKEILLITKIHDSYCKDASMDRACYECFIKQAKQQCPTQTGGYPCAVYRYKNKL